MVTVLGQLAANTVAAAVTAAAAVSQTDDARPAWSPVRRGLSPSGRSSSTQGALMVGPFLRARRRRQLRADHHPIQPQQPSDMSGRCAA
jgi:hypothetical protein